jgi:hypothetical protein
VLERGEPGDILVSDLVALGAELGDGVVDVAGGQSTTALRTRPSAPS